MGIRDFLEVPGLPGENNAITDVPGFRVGHVTLPELTGVTALVPPDVFRARPSAGGFVLNGAGELTGLHQAQEWGLIETPILLTGTMAVGACYQGCVEFLRHELGEDVIIPVVGECDDSFLCEASALPVRPEHALQALRTAADGPVAQGCVGAGTGMTSFGFKAGIGTSSRRLEGGTLGALVLSNYGRWHQLRVLGRELDVEPHLGDYPGKDAGSIIVVLATDLPLLPHQLSRVARRAALGVGRLGSSAGHGSGEIMLALSTGLTTPRHEGRLRTVTSLSDEHLNPVFEAAVQATEEAVLNALCHATETVGRQGRRVAALPLEHLLEGNSAGRPGN